MGAGERRAPSRTGGKDSYAWVLLARNRFIRDPLPLSLAVAKTGKIVETLPTPMLMPTGIHDFHPPFPFPRRKSSPTQCDKILKVSGSSTLPRRHRAGDISKTSLFASASGDGSCLLGLLNVRNQTTLIVYCCKRTTLVRNGKSGWQLLTSAPIKGQSL